MTKYAELTHFFLYFLFFQPWINQKCAEFELRQHKGYKSKSPQTLREAAKWLNARSLDDKHVDPPEKGNWIKLMVWIKASKKASVYGLSKESC